MKIITTSMQDMYRNDLTILSKYRVVGRERAREKRLVKMAKRPESNNKVFVITFVAEF